MADRTHPGPIVIPNCIEIQMLWSGYSRSWSNVLHAQYTLAGPLAPAIAENLHTAFKNNASGVALLQYLHSTVSLTGVRVKDLRTANMPFILSTSGALAGTGASTIMPLNVAVVISLYTAMAGRQFRGRIYYGGLDGGDPATGDVILPAVNAAFQAFTNANAASIATQGGQLAIAQVWLDAGPNKHNTATLPERPANVVPVITPGGIVARGNRFDTQRRRLGRG